MHAAIEPSGVKVEPHLRRDRAAESLLRVLRERPGDERGMMLQFRRLERLRDHRREARAQHREYLLQTLALHPSLELIEPVVVRLHAVVRARGCHLLPQRHELLERRRERIPIVALSRLDPRRVASRPERRLARFELAGEPDRVVVVPPRVAYHRSAPRAAVPRMRALRGGDRVAVRGRRRLAMRQLRERRLLLAARFRGRVRHHHELVPLQRRLDRAEVGQLAEARREGVVRGLRVAGERR
mmetsp:Transcript_9514/g.34635  ORF Transcript_9514/g.34635 Transcript_9514/m.34635 type:complete len:242 (+) Transcript_9514:909-1634(+)